MKLNKVKIQNFRSIEDSIISFEEYNCRVLVGKNEVGKSNILKALSLLGSNVGVKNIDLRVELPDEDMIREGEVCFIFTLDSEDKNEINSILYEKILSSENNSYFIFIDQDENYKSLYQYINEHLSEVMINVEIPSGIIYSSTFEVEKKYKVTDHWKKPSLDIQEDYYVDFKGSNKPLTSFDLVNSKEYELPGELVENATQEYIHTFLSTIITNYVDKNCQPETLFWQYDDNYLLPSRIDIEQFIVAPHTCLPLMSMFELAGVKDINLSISEAMNKNHGLKNLLERVAKRTTDHFRKVWEEYESIQFILSPNGNFIDAAVKDSFNNYELSQRSDGFKRFVSFLLFISAKVESNNMRNKLLLFDEPDLALHPSGQKYLRDEILKISKYNNIVYSTHSIFMIDKEEIGRHLIVEKENEKTKVIQVDESNYVDEEVLYNALGFSVFETLKMKNIIFEGWKDKKIFNLALTKIPDKYNEEIKKAKEFGLCHASGVKDIKNIASILDLVGRSYFILSDGDAPAKERQKEYQKVRQNGIWKRYDELVNKADISTIEDFIKPHCFVEAIEKLRNKYSQIPFVDEGTFTNISKSKLDVIDEQLRTIWKNKDERKKIMHDIKDEVFENLKQDDIEDPYYELIKNVVSLT